MNVYDYQSWQYNHSDELAKQMFAQQAHQALATSLPYRTEGAVMPVPSGTPWNVQGLPWGMPSPQPPIVQFTAQTHPEVTPKVTAVLHTKRKPVDIEPPIPAKQLITEEKMAAHLSSLHISSNYTSHMPSSEELMEVASTSGITPSNNERLKGTVILSEEIKRLRNEPLLPAALIERLEKPCLSLVVWEPKENILNKAVEEKKKEELEESIQQLQQRKGVLVHDTVMDVEM